MRLARPARLLSLAALFITSLAAHAGTVAVSYPPDLRFSDAGETPWQREATARDLAQHLQSLGTRYLPADRDLKLEVLDIDLAGEIRPSRHALRDLRVARGRADWPQIKLRYTLTANGQILKSGEESISDMDYLHHIADRYKNDSLPSEKRMLEQWFKTRFVSGGD